MTDAHTWTPLPHSLLDDPALCAEAVRLYGLLHRLLVWERQPVTIETLHARWPGRTTTRSFYRWITHLEAAGWLTWERKPGTAGLLLTLFTKPQPMTPGSQVGPEGMTPGSQPPASCDPTITTCDPTITTCDPTITTCDPTITTQPFLPHQDAPKRGPSDSLKDSSQTLRQTPPPKPAHTEQPKGGGGNSGPSRKSIPEGERLLREAGIRASEALARLGSLEPDVIRRTIASIHQRGARNPAGLIVRCLDDYIATGETPYAAQPRHDGGMGSGRRGIPEPSRVLADQPDAADEPDLDAIIAEADAWAAQYRERFRARIA
jgi:hypothetical protein